MELDSNTTVHDITLWFVSAGWAVLKLPTGYSKEKENE